MIVFDLNCSNGHMFEAWFRSSEDYEAQSARAMLSCPTCGDLSVNKAVMAPAVAAKGNQRSAPQDGPERTVAMAKMDPLHAAKLQAMVEKLAAMQSEALSQSAWVGHAFPEKARAMHYGDEPAAAIHGIANAGEARALIEEGVAVAPLPFPVVPPEERN